MTLTFIGISANWALIFGLLVLGAAAATRVGVFCIAVQAVFLNSALSAALVSHLTGSPWTGLLAGMILGFLTMAVFGLLVVVLRLEEIVAGIALNLFSFGASSLAVFVTIKGRSVAFVSPNAAPYVAAVSLACMVSALIAFIFDYSYLRTRLIAVKEALDVATISGIDVRSCRLLGLLLGGLAASVAGVCFACSQVSVHIDQWNEGLGFLALAVAFAVRGSLGWGAAVSAAFGVLRSLTLMPRVPKWIPYADTSLQALPYICVIALIAGIGVLGRLKRKRQV